MSNQANQSKTCASCKFLIQGGCTNYKSMFFFKDREDTDSCIMHETPEAMVNTTACQVNVVIPPLPPCKEKRKRPRLKTIHFSTRPIITNKKA